MDKCEYEIRPIMRTEWEMAMQLAWDTFLVFEAPEYEPLGVKNFHEFVKGKELKQLFMLDEYAVYGAFMGKLMIGVLAIRRKNHVSLLFVDEQYHRKGIASSLLKYVFKEKRKMGITEMTVNSSPYAVGFYHKLGFADLDKEISADGIRFTPMKIQL